MTRQIYVNLPVKNLDRSIEFFTRLGYRFNPQFTNENATCMIVSDSIFVMLLTEKFFQSFTDKAICDAGLSTEVMVCLSCDSREAVDDEVRKALAAGATSPRAPQDLGFMYGHGFEDLDGHIWELSYMDMSAMPQGGQPAETSG
ncbi:MAG: VOC family protein [Polaromonas sp.]